jgi:multimeric flavodoxin WrbA
VVDQQDGGRRVLFVLGSSRAEGNSELLARRAAASLPRGTQSTWLALRDLTLRDFADLRHVGDGSAPVPEGDEKLLFEATTAATEVVIVSPLYWYSVSSAVKRYLDHWAGWMRVPGAGFVEAMAGKTLWSVTVCAGDADRAQPLVDMLRHSAEFLRMQWGGALLGNGSAPGDVLHDADALAAAQTFLLPS